MGKILIANRGEIAVRVVRACAEMGIKSVAVYSDADKNALHVKKADEAYSLRGDPLGVYLNPNKLANLALSLGCDAVHPGYGFMSEDPAFADRCARRGVKFIGPGPSIIERMGDKTAARQAMIEAGIPVVPGSDGNVASQAEAVKIADEIGYPVMLKATNGGGGRGIRRCDSAAEVEANYERVVSEATKAFGAPGVFIEKCIVKPRHIEVQIIGDQHGNICHLYERDCSIQRRNQKLVEIAPSPQLTDQERDQVCEHAVNAAQAVGYVNAGTVEFLLDEKRNFYFMEMNTRLQVEHPVTEAVTGIDLVQEQIRVASGLPLSFSQEEIQWRGSAIELRINAEDPKLDFVPSFGRITRFYAPGGPGVRLDSAIYSGYVIPPYYDSLCAKLTVWALDWQKARKRGLRALQDTIISGIKTTAPYYTEILSHERLIAAEFDTSFVESHPELLEYDETAPREDLALALAAAVVANAGL
ncbi:MAG: acetyl-CoA carboxylase biotin carboxylase subunit [Betaproteobacteria bacterium AqS2]|uniref:Biotin carboxylase n=1 Tax=Candidatus Amphirhobacter heronislandensis TaxID=1732024 RepID=A0A930UF90_9GAMM|nr:acetyl-CoA carboxylase biotin carboxylase subunit [Betaproteobacteria bacterium AqS2]